MRRVIDIVFSVVGLSITAPLMTLIALLIRIESPGPILYSPHMIGQNGRVFSLLRFRTMSTVMTDSGTEQRLTRVGGLIRNTSLDHLPMLINLLKGDLTLVGPRPMEIHVVELKDPMWQQYFQVKPGVFNYAVLKLGKSWTPSRLSDANLNQVLELDYYQKRSSMLDLQLFIQWLVAYITSRGNVKARGIPDPEVEDTSQDQ